MIDSPHSPAAFAGPRPAPNVCVARKRSVRSANACGVAAGRVAQVRSGSGAFLAASLIAVAAAGAIAAGEVAHLELKFATASVQAWAVIANAATPGL
ncbi:hypothetical protein ACQUZK_08685 [Streptococcus pyogenes]|uniref:hypothetical protein n=1 Tax=Streptococcus pyogenes TaxID=1314 RepID=UPI003DA0587B